MDAALALLPRSLADICYDKHHKRILCPRTTHDHISNVRGRPLWANILIICLVVGGFSLCCLSAFLFWWFRRRARRAENARARRVVDDEAAWSVSVKNEEDYGTAYDHAAPYDPPTQPAPYPPVPYPAVPRAQSNPFGDGAANTSPERGHHLLPTVAEHEENPFADAAANYQQPVTGPGAGAETRPTPYA